MRTRFLAIAVIAGVLTGPMRCVSGADADAKGAYETALQEARQFDPQYCGMNGADRAKAVAAYNRALQARPDDLRNIEIEHRIAQLYAFYANPKTKEHPDPKAAEEVFDRIVKEYPPNTELWVNSQIGLASCKMMLGKREEALALYQRVLDLDPATLGATSEEKLRAQNMMRRLQVKLVDKVAYASRGMDPDQTEKTLRDIAKKHPGTDAARKANQKLIAVCLMRADAIVWGLEIDGIDLLTSGTTSEHPE